ncbi:unnamed protein product [Polarella glacialis]|uniref:Uncharacterized protein n=1 Tax=Polarella glacialis TaxID=89957 RepID=A0A813M148_POLGL|nr:unnamed protein product [Polarella glacialis]
MQQSCDADFGEDEALAGGSVWASLLLPRDGADGGVAATIGVTSTVASSPNQGIAHSTAGEDSLLARYDSVGSGPDQTADAGVQAFPSSCGYSTEVLYRPAAEVLGVAATSLGAGDAAQVADFLKGLRSSQTPADATTLDALLRLLRALPPPEGPRVLLDAIRHEQPALFERLHESMRRTQQRTVEGEK